MAKTIAVGTEKGGVGKTTTSVQVGLELAEQGAKVLLVENDPSGDATTALFGSETPDAILYTGITPGIANTMRLYTDASDIVPFQISENFHLIGATEQLATLSGTNLDPMYTFSEGIERLAVDYDYIIIDCAPSFGITFSSAILASKGGGIVIPVLADELSFKAANRTRLRIERMNKIAGGGLNILGVVVNRIETNPMPVSTKYYLEQFKETFGELALDSVIHKSVKISDAISLQYKVSDYDKNPKSKPVEQIRKLTKEIVSKLGRLS